MKPRRGPERQSNTFSKSYTEYAVAARTFDWPLRLSALRCARQAGSRVWRWAPGHSPSVLHGSWARRVQWTPQLRDVLNDRALYPWLPNRRMLIVPDLSARAERRTLRPMRRYRTGGLPTPPGRFNHDLSIRAARRLRDLLRARREWLAL